MPGPNWPYPATTLVLISASIAGDTTFQRGDRCAQEKEVGRICRRFLNPFPKSAPRDRLGFAKWIVIGAVQRRRE